MKIKSKIAIICNSSNPDFLAYFHALKRGIKEDQFLFFANKKVKREDDEIILSSYTNNSFLDKYFIIDFFLSFNVIYKLKKENVKKIHFITAHSTNFFHLFWAKIFRLKTAFTIHDLVPHPGKKAMFINWYNKLIVKSANFIVVHNEKYFELLKLEKENVFYIPLSGFRLKDIDRDFNENKNLLFFGRIESYKGVHNLYGLAKAFLKNGLDYKIIIAGKGKLPNVLTKEKLENIEIINNFIEEDELVALYKKCSFTILPYDSASQSGVIIHSYSYGTPVIAYDVGALSNYVLNLNTGIIVEHNDYNRIIKFLQDLNKEQYEKMRKNTIGNFIKKYSDTAFVNYSMELYMKWNDS